MHKRQYYITEKYSLLSEDSTSYAASVIPVPQQLAYLANCYIYWYDTESSAKCGNSIRDGQKIILNKKLISNKRQKFYSRVVE